MSNPEYAAREYCARLVREGGVVVGLAMGVLSRCALFILSGLLATAVGFAADAGALRKLRQEFRDPPKEYTQAPFWFWNGEIGEDGILEQPGDMQSKGVHGFVIHSRMGLSKKVGYMTPRWLELVKFAVEEAERRGMIVYLYDEGMYPSGSAHGKVVEGRPELASQGLLMEPGESADSSGVVSAGNGYTFRQVASGGVIRGVHFDEEDNLPGAPASADLLNPEATKRFIQFTHEPYRMALSEHFGKTVRGIFTDEPSILGRNNKVKNLRPWTNGLLPKISELAGYDFGPYLPLLWNESADGLHEVVRADYRRAVAAVMNETYYRPLSEWCERNGLALTGHPHGGGDMPPQRYFQQPGQDVVWRWVLPGETAVEGEQSLTGKTASSMAVHLGRDTVINECYGAYGWRLTMSEMKWLADWLFVRGTNLLMPHAFYYSVEGERLFERPPDLAWANLWWDHYQQFSDYTNRLSWLMRGGTPVAEVAIFAQEGEANWRAAKILLENQIEFFYLDEISLEEASIEEGKLAVGPMRYSVVVLDGADHVRPETERRLRKLTSGGVTVIGFDSPLRPHPLIENQQPPQRRWAPSARVASADSLLAAIRGVAASDLEAVSSSPHLRFAHRVKEGVPFYLLTNEGDTPIDTPVRLRQDSIPEVWNAETGRVEPARPRQKRPGTVELSLLLPPRGSTILAFTGSTGMTAKPTGNPEALMQINSGWKLVAGDRVLTDVATGSWTSLDGMAKFSGTGWYEFEVELPTVSGRMELDLGDVQEIAELEVNGTPAGVRLWPPYVFDVTTVLRPGKNRIRIGVTNTRANELTDEQLPSGLTGSVQLLTH